jgi:hypothetical protein
MVNKNTVGPPPPVSLQKKKGIFIVFEAAVLEQSNLKVIHLTNMLICMTHKSPNQCKCVHAGCILRRKYLLIHCTNWKGDQLMAETVVSMARALGGTAVSKAASTDEVSLLFGVQKEMPHPQQDTGILEELQTTRSILYIKWQTLKKRVVKFALDIFHNVE